MSSLQENEQSRAEDDRDYDYATSYFYFLGALKTLSLEASDQCEAMGYFNVAWELIDDLLGRGAAVLESPQGQLSGDEKMRFFELLEYLRKAPSEVTQVDNSRDKHLESMNNNFWNIPRSQSRKFIEDLSHETERTNSILWPLGASGQIGPQKRELR